MGSAFLPLVLPAAVVDKLFSDVFAQSGYRLVVDLQQQTVSTPNGDSFAFEVDKFRKHCLINGLDDIALTLQHVDDIRRYEERRRHSAPWLFY